MGGAREGPVCRYVLLDPAISGSVQAPLTSLVMSGVPKPVTKSYPGPAVYAPLAPTVMSLKLLDSPPE